jgi:hypothetical protein
VDEVRQRFRGCRHEGLLASADILAAESRESLRRTVVVLEGAERILAALGTAGVTLVTTGTYSGMMPWWARADWRLT